MHTHTRKTDAHKWKQMKHKDVEKSQKEEQEWMEVGGGGGGIMLDYLPSQQNNSLRNCSFCCEVVNRIKGKVPMQRLVYCFVLPDISSFSENPQKKKYKKKTLIEIQMVKSQIIVVHTTFRASLL